MTRRILLFILLLTAFNTVNAQKNYSYKIADLRPMYLEASENEKEAMSFNRQMRLYEGNNPLIIAYKGASEAVMAKHVWNPYHKLRQLKSAASHFEQAIQLNPKNAEIRFLRFTVEHYVPRYLNMSENIEADKKIILNSLVNHPTSGMPEDLARTIRDFMLSKDHSTEDEKKILKSIPL